MTAALSQAGAVPVVVQEAASKFTTCPWWRPAWGLALLPASVRVWQRAGVVFRALDGALPEVVLSAVRPKGRRHPAAARLIAFARDAATGRLASAGRQV